MNPHGLTRRKRRRILTTMSCDTFMHAFSFMCRWTFLMPQLQFAVRRYMYINGTHAVTHNK